MNGYVKRKGCHLKYCLWDSCEWRTSASEWNGKDRVCISRFFYALPKGLGLKQFCRKTASQNWCCRGNGEVHLYSSHYLCKWPFSWLTRKRNILDYILSYCLWSSPTELLIWSVLHFKNYLLVLDRVIWICFLYRRQRLDDVSVRACSNDSEK